MDQEDVTPEVVVGCLCIYCRRARSKPAYNLVTVHTPFTSLKQPLKYTSQEMERAANQISSQIEGPALAINIPVLKEILKEPVPVIHDEALSNAQQSLGMKYDAGKPRVNLLPWDALLQVSIVLTYGAKKYAADSWRTVPDALNRYKGALLRHWIAMEQGEWLDPESGLPHWAHIACNALFCCALACAMKKEEESKKVLVA